MIFSISYAGEIFNLQHRNVLRYLHEHATLLNARTLSRRIIALRHWHRYQDFSDPTAHDIIQKTLRGIYNIHGKPKKSPLLCTLEYLEKIIMHLQQKNDLIALRNSALLQVGFFGALRRSELVAIRIEDITWVPEGMEILIPPSKLIRRVKDKFVLFLMAMAYFARSVR